MPTLDYQPPRDRPPRRPLLDPLFVTLAALILAPTAAFVVVGVRESSSLWDAIWTWLPTLGVMLACLLVLWGVLAYARVRPRLRLLIRGNAFATHIAAMPQSRIPENNCDFLRFFLAVLVIFSHSYVVTGGENAGEPFFEFSRHQWTLGDIAVSFFFVLSGYLITHSILNSKSLVDFFRKRALRIYPAFIAAMGVAAFVVLPLASPDGVPGDAKEWMRIGVRTLLLQKHVDWSAFAANPLPHIVNGSTWTIFYELACYGLTAVLFSIALVRRRRFMLGLFVLVLVAHAFAWTRQWTWYVDWKNAFSFDPFHLLRFAAYYLAGTVFYLYRDEIPLRSAGAFAAVVALILVAPIKGALTLALPLLGTYALFCFAFSKTIRLYRFGQFGDFSYGIYLYGFPIQQLLVAYLGAGIGPLGLSLGASALAILAGAASWHGVEKRFMKMKHGRRAEAKPAVEPAAGVHEPAMA